VRCGICSTSQAHTYYVRIPTLKWFILGANVDAAAMINLSYIELPTISSILYPVMLYARWWKQLMKTCPSNATSVTS
jgi:hypothetical protein